MVKRPARSVRELSFTGSKVFTIVGAQMPREHPDTRAETRNKHPLWQRNAYVCGSLLACILSSMTAIFLAATIVGIILLCSGLPTLVLS
jgi:hypothetical protein